MSDKKVKALNTPKSVIEKEFFKDTGTRFEKGSARQCAFEVILKGVKAGKTVKLLRQDIVMFKQENGKRFNLDTAYVNYVLATHPEFFKVYTDGSIELLGEPTVDFKQVAKDKLRNVAEMRKTASHIKKMRDKTANR